ncbi:MAG: ABC transporter permease [Clostridiales Family XIII bacterium]|nr:ABC transporter permease [Clostridiales Family XIII bacterium]
MRNFPALFVGGLSRTKGMLVMAFAISVAVAFIVMGAVGASAAGTEADNMKLGFVDRDGGAVAGDFARYLTDGLGIVLVRSDDVDAMNSELVEKHISGLIEVPPGFEGALLSGTPKPIGLTFMGDYANEAFTRGYLESYMNSLETTLLAADGDAETLAALLKGAEKERVPVETIVKDASLAKAAADKDGYYIMVGFFMMFSFIMSICIATMLFTDRMEGTYRRIKAGRVSSFEYVASVCAIGIVLMFLIDGPSLILYALSGADPGVPFGATAGLLFAFSLFVIAFGILVGISVSGSGGIIAVITAVTTISSMLGGAWFPLDRVPQAFRTLGYVTPQHWFYEAVSAWQTGVGSTSNPAFIILLAAALCFILAGARFTSNKGLAR